MKLLEDFDALHAAATAVAVRDCRCTHREIHTNMVFNYKIFANVRDKRKKIDKVMNGLMDGWVDFISYRKGEVIALRQSQAAANLCGDVKDCSLCDVLMIERIGRE